VASVESKSMIRKSGYRSSLATNAKRVCAEIMLKQRDEIMIRFNLGRVLVNQLDWWGLIDVGYAPLATKFRIALN